MAFAELKSSSHPGRNAGPITTQVAWKLGEKAEQQSIAIQPVEVAPQAPRWVVAAYSLLKDFGLPLLLGVLAYLFQQVLQERSRVESARSAMLPAATSNAIKYLLPAAGAVRNLRRTLTEAEAIPRDQPQWKEKQQQAFFYFVFLFKRMRDLVLVGGGYFLDDVHSEVLAAECWRAIHRRAIEHFGYLDLSYAQDLMGEHETISLFLAQFNGPLTPAQIAARRVAEKFPEWITGTKVNVDLRLLLVLAEILQIESNHLFLGWYEEVESPDEKVLANWEAAIESFQTAHPDILQGLTSKLDDYVKTLSWKTRWRYRSRKRHR